MEIFKDYSKAGIGILVIILASLAQHYGLDFDEGTATESLMGILEGVGYLLAVIGQLTRKDLKMGVMRR